MYRSPITNALLCISLGVMITAAVIVLGLAYPTATPWSGRMGSIVEIDESRQYETGRVVVYFAVERGLLTTRTDIEVRVPGGLAEESEDLTEGDIPRWSGLRDWRSLIEWQDGFRIVMSRVGAGWPFVGVVADYNDLEGSGAMSSIRLRPLQLMANTSIATGVMAVFLFGTTAIRAVVRRAGDRCVVCGHRLIGAPVCPECGSRHGCGRTPVDVA